MAQDSNCVEDPEISDGLAFVEQGSVLTRLHYFDGKFLRADAFATEQDYHRARVMLANRAGGWGVVHGLALALDGAQLTVKGGMALTPAGNVVLAESAMVADLTELLKAARPAPATAEAAADSTASGFADCPTKLKAAAGTAGLALYEITVGPASEQCGTEAVYEKLCQSACASTVQRPYWREGVALRLRPFTLALVEPKHVPFGDAHLRNRVASAWFAHDDARVPSQLSAAGLAGTAWCGTAPRDLRDEVTIGLLMLDGGASRIDAWSGRRERMEMPPRAYWQGVMAQRPWNAFLAQILQFQCQLSGVLDGSGTSLVPPENCEAVRAALTRARTELARIRKQWAGTAERLAGTGKQVQSETTTRRLAKHTAEQVADLDAALALFETGNTALPTRRMLIAAGFLDLPPAGYLPVVPNKVALLTQLQRMFGEGVNLQLHAVRAAEIGHLVEQAQHLERISLTRGIDDPQRIEDVEVFVPDGIDTESKKLTPGTWWDWRFGLGKLTLDKNFAALIKKQVAAPAPAPAPAPAAASAAVKLEQLQQIEQIEQLQKVEVTEVIVAVTDPDPPGLARTYVTDSGSFALVMLNTTPGKGKDNNTSGAPVAPSTAVWVGAEVAADPFLLALDDSTPVVIDAAIGTTGFGILVNADVTLKVTDHQLLASGDTMIALEATFSTRIDVVIQQALTLSVTIPGTGHFTLARRGDADTGHLFLDDKDFDLSNGAGEIRWDVDPREAVLELVFQWVLKAGPAIFDKVQAAGLGAPLLEALGTMLPAAALAAAAAAGSGAQTTGIPLTARLRLARAQGLPGMPAPDSERAVLALAGLKFIAEQAGEPGFEPRARRRMFPTLDDKPPARTVRPVLDWVMFRRARTTLCAAPCSTVAETAIDAVQVWHLRADGAGQLNKVKEALAKGNGAALVKMGLARVGVLHYKDAGTRPEEAGVHVRAMWQATNHGTRVVLGRAWEDEPATGQGWQNHARLRAMLAEIASIVAPPPVGEGAITVMEPPAAPLANATLDGGMIVITADEEALTVVHRVVLTTSDAYAGVVKDFGTSADAGRKSLEKLIKDSALGLALSVDFVDGKLAENAKKDLAKALDQLKQRNGRNLAPQQALRIDRSGTTPPEAAARHQAVLGELGSLPTGGDDGKRTYPAGGDLGDGAESLSLVWMQDNS